MRSRHLPGNRLRWGAVPILAAVSLGVWAGTPPADRLPDPRPEPCLVFDADPEEGEMATAAGLGYEEVTSALNRVIQTALYCPRPEGFDEVHLTYELVVGCNGLVSTIETTDDGGAPASYVTCVRSVIAKADFPGHDMEGGLPITYPVNVAW